MLLSAPSLRVCVVVVSTSIVLCLAPSPCRRLFGTVLGSVSWPAVGFFSDAVGPSTALHALPLGGLTAISVTLFAIVISSFLPLLFFATPCAITASSSVLLSRSGDTSRQHEHPGGGRVLNAPRQRAHDYAQRLQRHKLAVRCVVLGWAVSAVSSPRPLAVRRPMWSPSRASTCAPSAWFLPTRCGV